MRGTPELLFALVSFLIGSGLQVSGYQSPFLATVFFGAAFLLTLHWAWPHLRQAARSAQTYRLRVPWEKRHAPSETANPSQAPVQVVAHPVPDAEDDVGHHYYYGSTTKDLVGTATLLWHPNERGSMFSGSLVVSNFTGAQSVTIDAMSEFSDDKRTVIATFAEPVGPFKVDVSRDLILVLDADTGKIVSNGKNQCHVSLPVSSVSNGIAASMPETIRLFFHRRKFEE